MKQIFQNLRTGAAETLEIPTPHCPKGCVLVQSQCSLISPGTERMLADFGRGGWISKARQQPDKVKQVLQKMRTDGVEATVRAVFSKLDQPLPVGYSNVGTVIQVGEGVKNLKVLDRVVSNGYHAELVAVPENLVAKIPDDVSDEAAAFTVLGAIALQGVRLAAPSLGETFSVFGLGLLGVLTCQILKANGCKVIGIDISEERVETAKRFGVEGLVVAPNEDPTERVINANGGQEVDGVLITASTRSNGPIASAPRMTRKRGRIILVGVVGLNLERTEFFKKELTFQVSCSYGPGRYDEGYEKEGLDYPVGYVRWTEQRNFEAVLELIRSGNLDVRSLITERIPFDGAAAAYDRILTEAKGYGYLFQYPSTPLAKRTRIDLVRGEKAKSIKPSSGAPTFGFIGAGNYVRGVLLPSFASTEARFTGVVSQSGMGSADLARKFGFNFHATDVSEVLNDKGTNVVVVATRHNTHAELTVRALQAGKHVFVEKPLAMNREEAMQVKKAFHAAP
ncbi:MAG: bi-domain-containing oxidoreductase, partial [Bdellovibrionales bacterium]|nr:bi-domain-containing oxidoreductase [Bdellovibrionales bacterium]